MQVGLLQRSAGRNSWHSGETASISPERCGSVSLWCSTPGPYHTSLVQHPLASGAAEDLFQDRGPCMEMYPWCRSRLSTGSMFTSGECPMSSSSTVRIDWMCGAAKSVDVNRPAELQFPRSHSLEQPAVCSARRQSFTEHILAAAEGLSVWTVMHTTRRRCGVLWLWRRL